MNSAERLDRLEAAVIELTGTYFRPLHENFFANQGTDEAVETPTPVDVGEAIANDDAISARQLLEAMTPAQRKALVQALETNAG